MFSAHRSRSNGQMELHSFNRNDPAGGRKSVEDDIDTRNTSEEHILGGGMITKTVETDVIVERSYVESGRVVKTPF
jgi:hypothetical protein